jgi:hypothetical protein
MRAGRPRLRRPKKLVTDTSLASMHRVPRLLSRTASPCWTARLRASESRVWSTTAIRHAHTRRQLPYAISEGLGDFLSADALQVLAVDYQEGLLQRLNEQVKGKRFHRFYTCHTLSHVVQGRIMSDKASRKLSSTPQQTVMRHLHLHMRAGLSITATSSKTSYVSLPSRVRSHYLSAPRHLLVVSRSG